METYTYKIVSYYEGDSDRAVTYGKGGWDKKKAQANRNAALKRTDNFPGLYAYGYVVPDAEKNA
jgi:hypothetical protein